MLLHVESSAAWQIRPVGLVGQESLLRYDIARCPMLLRKAPLRGRATRRLAFLQHRDACHTGIEPVPACNFTLQLGLFQ